MTVSNPNVVGEWHLWTFYKEPNAGIMRIYMDDELLGEATGMTKQLEAASQCFLFNSAAKDAAFDGSLDELRIFFAALSINKIRALYVNPSGNAGGLISAEQVKTGVLKSENDNLQFNLNTGALTADTFSLDTDKVKLHSDEGTMYISTGANSTYEVDYVFVGNIWKSGAWSDDYGLAVKNVDGDFLFELSVDDKQIAGWDITATTLSKNNVTLNSAVPSITVGADNGQRTVLDGSNNNIKFYNSYNVNVLKIDDNLGAGAPGIYLRDEEPSNADLYVTPIQLFGEGANGRFFVDWHQFSSYDKLYVVMENLPTSSQIAEVGQLYKDSNNFVKVFQY